MKNLNKLTIAAALLLGLYSCKQETVVPPSTVAAFNFVNASVGTSPLFVNFNNQGVIFSKLSGSSYINYGASNVYSPVAGDQNVAFVQNSDTLHHIFQGNFNLANHNIYTFFLTGTTAQPDMVLIHEHLQQHADSVAGIRFINLSTGSGPISVDIQGQANGSEVPSLAYKNYTGFKTYTANHTIASYVFEFRDAATGNLLASYTLSGVNTKSSSTANTVLFRNLTLALIGQPSGGTVPQSVIRINNY